MSDTPATPAGEAATPPAAPTPAPPPAPAPAAPVSAGKFAIYDLIYLRFVDTLYPTKKAAQAKARDLKIERYEIREV